MPRFSALCKRAPGAVQSRPDACRPLPLPPLSTQHIYSRATDDLPSILSNSNAGRGRCLRAASINFYDAVSRTGTNEVIFESKIPDGLSLLQKTSPPVQKYACPSQVAYPASPYPRRKTRCATKLIHDPTRMPQRDSVLIPKATVGIVEHMGWKDKMEDRHAVVTDSKSATQLGAVASTYCLAGVFDGHYGHLSADYAAKHLPRAVLSHPLLRSVPDGHRDELPVLQEVLKSSFSSVDARILDEARKDPKVWRCGTTALLTFLRGNVLYTANAGDCRAVLCRSGVAHRVTQDHNIYNPYEKHRLTEIGGKLHFMRGWRVYIDPRDGLPGRGLNVTRGLGDYHFKEPLQLLSCEPDVQRTVLEPGDTFLIVASDGLWSVFTDAEAVDLVKEELRGSTVLGGEWASSVGWAHKAGNTLIETALDRGAIDNITCCIVMLDWGRQEI